MVDKELSIYFKNKHTDNIWCSTTSRAWPKTVKQRGLSNLHRQRYFDEVGVVYFIIYNQLLISFSAMEASCADL